MKFFRNIFSKWFKSRSKQDAVVIPAPTTETPSTPPVIVPLPEPVIISTRIKKTKNEGTPVNPDWDYIWDNLEPDSTAEAKKLLDYNIKFYLKYKTKMIEVEKITGIPEWFIAGATMREMGWDMNGCLHNGDPWNRVTVNVPKGRGPWSSWVEAAVDALAFDKITPEKVNTIAKACEKIFRFNGTGYKTKIGDHGVVEYSPYCVAYSNFHDETSKYKSDGKYDPKAKEQQLGVITFWKEIERRGLATISTY